MATLGSVFDSSSITNLSQLVSPSVALPAELVDIKNHPTQKTVKILFILLKNKYSTVEYSNFSDFSSN